MICPKCGSEMDYIVVGSQFITEGRYAWVCPSCGFED